MLGFYVLWAQVNIPALSSFLLASVVDMMMVLSLHMCGLFTNTDFTTVAILLNSVVFLLYWTVDNDSKKVREDIIKVIVNDHSTSIDYLKIFDSLNLHGVINILLFAKLFSVKLTYRGLLSTIILR